MTTSEKRDDVSEVLKKANEIQKKIDDINSFLRTAERVWTGKLSTTIFKKKFLIKTDGYGIYSEIELDINTKLKNKMLDVLREEVVYLKKRIDRCNGNRQNRHRTDVRID